MSKSAVGMRKLGGMNEEDEMLSAFAGLLAEYDPYFSVSLWMVPGQKRAAIFRCLSGIDGLRHHFTKVDEVGATSHREANRRALAELLEKVEDRDERGSKENRVRTTQATAARESGCPKVSASCESSSQLPATRQRESLGITEMDPLALDEAARKMTGRHASSLGPAELAYIIELQQGQIKAKLAAKQKEMEKLAKRSQYEQELAIAQLGKRVDELERQLKCVSKVASSEEEKATTARLNSELRSLKKQRMRLVMELGLEKENATKELEELKQKENMIDEVASKERSKLKIDTVHHDQTEASNTESANGKTESTLASSARATQPKRSSCTISRKIVLNDNESADEPSGSCELDKVDEVKLAEASSQNVSERISKRIIINSDDQQQEGPKTKVSTNGTPTADAKVETKKGKGDERARNEHGSSGRSQPTKPPAERISKAIIINEEVEPIALSKKKPRDSTKRKQANVKKQEERTQRGKAAGEEEPTTRISRTITINTEEQEKKEKISRTIVLNTTHVEDPRPACKQPTDRPKKDKDRAERKVIHVHDEPLGMDDHHPDFIETCEAEREALLELRHAEGLPTVWGVDTSVAPAQCEEEVFLKRLKKARKQRISEMKEEAEAKLRRAKAKERRRRSRASVAGEGGLIVVLDTPWAAKRKTARQLTTKPKLGLPRADETEEDDGTASDPDSSATSLSSSSSSSSSSSTSDREEDAGNHRQDEDRDEPQCEDRWDDGSCDTEKFSDEAHASRVSITADKSQEVEDSVDEEEGEEDVEEEEEEEVVEEQDVSEASVWRERKGKGWRWERDRHERERIDGKRRCEISKTKPVRTSTSSSSSSSASSSSSSSSPSSRETINKKERRTSGARLQMKAMMENCLNDLRKPPTALLLEDLSSDDSNDEQPVENRKLQILVDILEARAAARKTTKQDEEFAGMSSEECKRAMWGDAYRSAA